MGGPGKPGHGDLATGETVSTGGMARTNSSQPRDLASVKPDPVKTDPVTTEPETTGGSISGSTQPPAKGGGTMKIAGLGVAGVGIIGVGVGVMFGLRARSAASDAEGIAMGQPWDPAIETRGEKASKNAKIFLAVGGAAVVAGGVMYFLGASKSNESSGVSFIPSDDGASVAWTSDF